MCRRVATYWLLTVLVILSGCQTDPGELTSEEGAQPDVQPQIDPGATPEIGPKVRTPTVERSAPTAADEVMAEVKGQKIGAREVLKLIMDRYRPLFDQAMQIALRRRVIDAENKRLDIQVAKSVVDKDVENAIKKAEQYYQLQYQMSVRDALDRQGAGMYEAFVGAAREDALYTRTLHRMVRYEMMRQGILKVRHIVVKDPEKANVVRAKIEQGADFKEMARQHSFCSSRKQDGALPMVVPGQYGPRAPEVERAIWALKIGEISQVVKARTGYHIFKVIYRRDRSDQPYAKLEPHVLKSLEQYKIFDVEIEWWHRHVRSRYPIKQNY